MTYVSPIVRELETVPFDRTGMQITRVGFGAWALGGGDWAVGWGGQEDAASVAAIRHAVTRGVNWIDTAAVYGLGRSERVVGMALRQIPPSERPLVFTKCGLVWDEARPQVMPRQMANPSSIRREVEDSLRRLGVAGERARAAASFDPGSRIRETMRARTRSRQRLSSGPRIRSRPILRAVPRAAATWPCGRVRVTVKASRSAGMTTPPFNTPRRPSIWAWGQSDRLQRVRLRTLPS